MGKIVIIEEKADKMIDKLEKIKTCVEDVIDCFTECMDGSDGYRSAGYKPEKYYNPYRINDTHNDEWDDEYEVMRRRGNRRGYERPEKVMRMYDDGGMTRY